MDLAKLRNDTPGIAHCLNLNNAGAALMPAPVVEVLERHLRLEAEIGGQAAAAKRRDELEAVHASIARLIGAPLDSIALMTNATRAWQLAFYGFQFSPGDRILTSRAEYGSNYVAFLQVQKRTGCVIDVIPDDEHGATDPHGLEAMIDERVKLIAVTWVPTNGGLVNPAAAIGRIARAHAIPYLLDACQAIGQMPANVDELQCDFLSATGRKWLRGPRGTGFLYVSPAMLDRVEPAMLDHTGGRWVSPEAYELRADARRYECYERPIGATLGLGAAVDYALALGVDQIQDRVDKAASSLRRALTTRPGIVLRDLGSQKCGIVTFSHDRLSAGAIRTALERDDILVGVTPPEGTLLDATARSLGDLVRISPHCYNSQQDIDALLAGLDALLENPPQR